MKEEYYAEVMVHIGELMKEYPWTEFTILPTVEPAPIRINTIAANRSLIENTLATRQDFTGSFSKELNLIVPFDYEVEGCQVYGGKWIDEGLIPAESRHFYERNWEGLFQFCVGVPESFRTMKNVILENVRTADRMLTAYELFQTGQTKGLQLKAYSHGERGENEYRQERRKYKTKL